MMTLRSLSTLAVTLLTAASTFASPTNIEIGTKHGLLQFDVGSFHVIPGAEVKLTLKNSDEMQHNLIICTPGPNMHFKVAQKAWALGAQAIDKHFVPDMPEVLHHTRIVDPGKSDTITFTAPNKEGDYPYVCTIPGHAFTMKGIMQVSKSAPVKSDNRKKKKKQKEDPRFIITATDSPVVKRAFVDDGPSRAVMIGFPGGVNACFDAESCSVQFGWFGRFLDVGPDWGSNPGHRGGKPVKTLGERFDVGNSDFPIRIGSPHLVPQVKFNGYDWNGKSTPVLHFTVNGSQVLQRITPAPKGIGLVYEYSFQNTVAPVFIKFNTSNVTVTSDSGKLNKGVLRIPEDKVDSFKVTVTSNTQG
ncbi:plastocyanin/azurin family copper-binding protein [Verrucomicrobia bacterium]|nr:plastocyanin/azurin family copper-binding protein [Verrucomicrobiota bacterium]